MNRLFHGRTRPDRTHVAAAFFWGGWDVKFVALMAMVTALLPARASNLPQVTIEPVKPDEITIDGQLTEPVYGSGEWQGGFHQLTTLRPAAEPVTFRIFTDGARLVLAARVQEPLPEQSAVVTKRDGPVWRNDAVEMFVQANDDRSSFLHVLVNRAGTVTDIEYRQGGFLKSFAWDASVEAAVRDEDGGWTAEMALPLAELRIDPRLSEWRIQVARSRSARDGAEAETATWSPAPSGLQKADSFGRLAPGQLDLGRFGWTLAPEAPRVVRRGDAYFLRQPLSLRNESGAYRNVVVTSVLEGDPAARGSKEFGIARGKGTRLTTEIPLGGTPRRAGTVRHTIALALDPQTILAGNAGAVAVDYVPVELRLTEPGYRATIFATQNLPAIRAQLRLVDETLPLEDVRAFLRRGEERVRPAMVTAAGANRWTIEARDIGDLPDGDYLLEATFRLAGEMRSLERKIRKVPRAPGEVWIDARGVLYRDGEPFPAYGFLFGRWDDFARVRLPGMFMNVAAPLWATPPFAKMNRQIEALAALDVCAGLYVPTASPDGLKTNTGKKPLTAAEVDDYRALARAARPNPHVLFYYLNDEPEGHGIHPERLREIYRILAEEDPYHPVMVVNDSAEGVREFQIASDISDPDPYPLFLQGGGAARPLDRIGLFLDEAVVGEESFRARWLTPQAFNYSFYNVEGNRGPTAEEMRSQQTIGLIHGAVGVTWYPEYMVWDEPGVFASLAFLSKEFRALFPLLAKSRPQVLKTGADLSAGFSRDGKKALLMVVNTRWKERDVTLSDERFSAVPEWRRLGTDQPVPGGAREITLRLGPHEAALLASPDVAYPAGLSWKEVTRREAEMRAAAHNVKNIALASNGASAKGIHLHGTAYLRPMILIDGLWDPRSIGLEDRPFRPGEGVEIDFGRERAPARLRLRGSNIASGVVNAWENGGWREIARLTAPLPEDGWKLSSPPTRTLQIVANAVTPGDEELRIGEIEIYEN